MNDYGVTFCSTALVKHMRTVKYDPYMPPPSIISFETQHGRKVTPQRRNAQSHIRPRLGIYMGEGAKCGRINFLLSRQPQLNNKEAVYTKHIRFKQDCSSSASCAVE
jgi:hypothetical protein